MSDTTVRVHPALPWLVAFETLTVAILLVNVTTFGNESLASAIGPIHGTSYLAVIGLVFYTAGRSRTAKWLSFVPVIGGWLALRALQRRR